MSPLCGAFWRGRICAVPLGASLSFCICAPWLSLFQFFHTAPVRRSQPLYLLESMYGGGPRVGRELSCAALPGLDDVLKVVTSDHDDERAHPCITVHLAGVNQHGGEYNTHN